MKKTVLSLLCMLLCLLLFSGCRQEPAPSVSAQELTELLVQECKVESAMFLDKPAAMNYLGLEDAVCTDAFGFQALDSALPQIGFVLVCPDALRAKEAKEALETILKARIEQCHNYSPSDLEIAEQCRVVKRGLWLSLFLSTNHEQQEAFFAAAFSDEPLPTLIPTPEPTPEPTPIPTEIPVTPEPVQEKQPVSDSWFDDVLFVGDSIVNSMKIYVQYIRATERPECMGKVTFFCMPNFSFARAASDNIYNLDYFPIYQHQARRVEDVLQLTGCKKLLIGMGANELPQYGAEETVQNVQKLMELCLAVNPELEIYLMNHMPCVFAEKEYGIDNRMIREYNEKLKELCREKGYHYLDIYSAVANEEGLLSVEDCADPMNAGVHPSPSCCEKWLNYLYEHCG